MVRYVIAVGDTTDHGGQVTEGDEGSKLFGKFPIAGKGHKVYCPQCKGFFQIVDSIPSHGAFGGSRGVAVSGMKTACGATLISKHKLIQVEMPSQANSSSQQAHNTVVPAYVGHHGKITLPMLRKIWTHTHYVSDQALQEVADELNANLEKWHLDNEYRLYHFMAQVFQETGPEFTIAENLSYSVENLPIYFSYYRHHPEEQELDGKTSHHPANQISIANKVYAHRNGNHDIASGDGWRYRGRGMKQLTGRGNYRDFTVYSKHTWNDDTDFEVNPDLLSTSIKYAARSALYFWDKNKIYAEADKGFSFDVSRHITKIVNSGLGHAEQEKRYENLEDMLHKHIFHSVFN